MPSQPALPARPRTLAAHPVPTDATLTPHPTRARRRALLAVGLAAASWGSAGAVAAILHRSSGLGPIAVSFWRFAIGALLLVAARPFLRRPTDTVRPGLPALIGTGILMAVFQTCYLASVDLAGLALGTTATLGAAPVLTALGARAVFGERLGRRGVATIVLAVTGLALLAFGSDATSGVAASGATASGGGTAPLWGLLCALGSATGSAAINLLTQAQTRDGRAHDAYDRALSGFAVGALGLLALAAATGPLLPSGHHLATAVVLLGYLGAVPTALAYSLFFAALTVVRATAVSVMMMLEPVAALLLGITLLSERLTLPAAAGTATLLAAVALLRD
ncbi:MULTISPECIES: DMT family transporter [Streptacidiphilus]|uniref:DMT family transporter n=1 Tax=Streptacidiphilus cavernicola TaxID=3342716 RepID=A0ABV6UJH9_9ACTN|nr:DMT family transporter [Streptacidiphilus jeojiense]